MRVRPRAVVATAAGVVAVAASVVAVLGGSGPVSSIGRAATPAVGAARPVPAPASVPPAVPTPAIPGTVTTLHLHAPGTSGDRAVEVYRPSVPDVATLPVLYLLHGVPGQTEGLLESTGVRAALDAWLTSGGAPFVVAVPDGNGDNHDDTEWADAADGSDQLETFVTQTVVGAVEGFHLRPSRLRAIGGFSMGGYGALNLGVRHPELFGSVVSVAGYGDLDDPDGVFDGRPTLERANTPARHLASLRGRAVYLGVGTDDDEPVVDGQAASLSAALSADGVRHTLNVTPGEHDWSTVVTQWPAICRFLAASWQSQ